MARMIFIKEIIAISKEPKLCPTCKRHDRLERENMVREERSGGRTIMCTRCEALIVMTEHTLGSVELSAIRGDDTIMLKEPHLIRKVVY